MSEYTNENVTVEVLIGFDEDGRPHYKYYTGKLRKYEADKGVYVIQEKNETTFETFIPMSRIINIISGKKSYFSFY